MDLMLRGRPSSCMCCEKASHSMPSMLPFLSVSASIKERWRLSLFEKVILINTLMLIAEALAGLWITSHSLITHHYLIDTSFIVAATLFSVLINVVLLRASFHPLFSLLRTIRAVGAGDLDRRADDLPANSEIGELAQAFNTMLDQLESTRRQQAMLSSRRRKKNVAAWRANCTMKAVRT